MIFARFAERIGQNGRLTIKFAAQWASNSGTGRRSTAARRIEVLRRFAAYCRQFDPATEFPPRYLFGRAHHRLAPHIFTDDEVLDLLAASTVSIHPVVCAVRAAGQFSD
ncbi:hypothetical protein [Paraburkholderia sp. RL17-373-BIF-A]|uniref:hypothetical protein n=1 Tax=Paraburkholderia sp. RL17-373-BIF-A TaxID=3031629 RepID=UPI0038B7277B